MKVAVIGDGGWGTALALTLRRNGHAPCVWGPDAAYIGEIRRTRRNRKFLPGVELPEDGAEAVAVVVPSKYMRAVLEGSAGAYRAAGAPPALSATKGFDEATRERMTELLAEAWGASAPAALSGPSIAPETARGVPTAVTIASADEAVARRFQELFTGPTFRAYTSDDVRGVEYGGAFKNVLALAAGVCDGLGFGHNAKAALLTRGLAEMTRMSPQSRNRTVGERLGRGETLAQILEGMEQVAEGVWTCSTALALAREAGIEAPVMVQVEAILHHGRKPREAVAELMGRDPRAERD
jgi:glycerol-3-phosphate dehydrogenase (NAD(P)+)